jgi:hypothetical protein
MSRLKAFFGRLRARNDNFKALLLADLGLKR